VVVEGTVVAVVAVVRGPASGSEPDEQADTSATRLATRPVATAARITTVGAPRS
jgi:hypothetical protein